MSWLKSKVARIILIAVLGAGLVQVGVNPKYATVIINAVSTIYDDVNSTGEPLIIKDEAPANE